MTHDKHFWTVNYLNSFKFLHPFSVCQLMKWMSLLPADSTARRIS